MREDSQQALAGTDSPATSAGERERSKLSYFSIVGLLILATEVVGFEFTFIYPAVGQIAAEFQTQQVAWALTILYLGGAVVVPVVGKLADIHGKKKMLVRCAVCFLAGTLVCALAPSFLVFMTGRALQASALPFFVLGYGLIRDLLPARLVPLGLGCLATSTGISAILSTFLGGWLIDSYGFRATFWFLFGYMGVLLLAVIAFLPESSVRIRQRIDYRGALLLALGCAVLLIALGMKGVAIVAALLVSASLLTAFCLSQRKAASPLIDASILGRPAFYLTLATTGSLTVAWAGYGFLFPQLLMTPHGPGTEYGFGLNAVELALWHGLPMGLGTMLCGTLGGWLARRSGPRVVLILGALLLVAACVMVAFVAPETDNTWIFRLMSFTDGAAAGFFQAGTQNFIVDTVPADRQGISGSMNFMVQSLGGSLATAGLTALLLHYPLGTGGAGRFAFTWEGYRTVFLVAAACALVALAIGLARRDGRTPASGGAVSGAH
ncbi:MFS transporter [Streptomyces boluensis]|uniref:MFS transporter n=1 Tax=Streptomyces boluensis TaxID=1775135 RepID=A0A964UM10_9ACTN|nr:MFS transporter [Streptomyces boluensis]NBE50203.1 MFS transporter [Streptomyces boluensis]